MNQIIITTTSGEEAIALNEIALLDSDSRLEKWLDKGVGLINLSTDYYFFIHNLLQRPPIFIRHICPVDIALTHSSSCDILENILTSCNLIQQRLIKEKSFSVQTRIFSSEINLKPMEINQCVSNYFVENGCLLDIHDPSQIISIHITETHTYIGLSDANFNLSSWAGGAIRFHKDENQISRAEFKLLEAIKTFQIQLKKNGICLDLGAAPGGFTRVLRNLGQRVVAVDPADIDKSLLNDPNIKYIKTSAQNYFRTNSSEKFDFITNDMKMDINDSIDIMVLAANFLSKDGLGFITLKLPKNNKQKITFKAFTILREHFMIVGAKQLFHNRNEVTVILQNNKY